MSNSEEPWLRVAARAAAVEEAEQLERVLDTARRLSARGAPRIWFSAPGGRAAGDEALRLAVSVALHCERVRVVAAGLPLDSWIRVAEDAATADGLCGGRLELAFRDIPDEGALERLRLAWSGAPVPVGPAGDGGALRIEIHPRPVRADGPPLWAEAATPEAAARLAQLELGALVADVAGAQAHRRATRGLALPVAIVEPSPDAQRRIARSAAGVSGAAIGLTRVPID